MSFALVQCPDAFFKRKERLVDLCSVDSGLFVHVHVVCASFVARQVDKRYLAEQFLSVFEGDLQDGMRP